MATLRVFIRKLLALVLFISACFSLASENPASTSKKQSRWLWVKDYYSGLGMAGASVDIAPGDKCLGQTNGADVKWTAHYTPDGAGRVLVHGLPEKLSCRVTVNGQQLNVFSYGSEFLHEKRLPSWIQSRVFTSAISTMPDADRNRTSPEHYWDTNDPTLFRSYIEDPDTGDLIANVKVTALPSGITTTSDANGLFTLEVPAEYRKSKFPTMATQTLVFSKNWPTRHFGTANWFTARHHTARHLPKGKGTLLRTGAAVSGEPLR